MHCFPQECSTGAMHDVAAACVQQKKNNALGFDGVAWETISMPV
jgi:hypothetical protein